jgi:hypothetical protein
MKNKKKLKKIEEFLEDYNRDTISMHSAFHTIREIVDGTYQDEEEPEPEFEPGDQVCILFNEDLSEDARVGLIFDDTNYEIQEMEDDGTSALIQVWVDVEHLSKV